MMGAPGGDDGTALRHRLAVRHPIRSVVVQNSSWSQLAPT
jgi:hypothetical protein